MESEKYAPLAGVILENDQLKAQLASKEAEIAQAYRDGWHARGEDAGLPRKPPKRRAALKGVEVK